jgi:hypothetical protein
MGAKQMGYFTLSEWLHGLTDLQYVYLHLLFVQFLTLFVTDVIQQGSCRRNWNTCVLFFRTVPLSNPSTDTPLILQGYILSRFLFGL